MILGLGTDLADMRRIERALNRFGDRFLGRIFTPAEQRACLGRANTVGRLAQRFAAKEACAKALGTGLRRGVFWRDMEVYSLPSGKPELKLSAGAWDRLQTLVPDGMVPHINVSMSDEFPLAQAVVILSARAPLHAPAKQAKRG